MTTPPSSNVYYRFPQWMLDQYGRVLHRVPLDLGFGCPNRSEDGSGGCAFCAENGGRARQILQADTLEEQITQGIEFARRRYGATAFMAYVQAFTGTFAPESEQQRRLNRIAERFPFGAISIGTRPDCLSPETLDSLCELRKRLDVWIELGVQTAHNETLHSLERGHTWEQSRDALQRLHAAGLRAAVHLITGLPGETRDHVRHTATELAALPFDGIKIHNLHILKNTGLAAQAETLNPPDEYEHAEMVMDILRRIPSGVAVMRIQTDSDPKDRIAPHWSMSKGRFAEFVQEQMCLRETRQGDLLEKTIAAPAEESPLEPIPTGDGSPTFWNDAFREHYHAPPGAYTEALTKYLRPSRLEERLARGDLRLLDICFGLGYNTRAVCESALRHPENRLHITALEADRRVVRQAAGQETRAPLPFRLVERMPGASAPAWQRVLRELWQQGRAEFANVSIQLLWGDARYTLRQAFRDAAPFDIVFLDPFSTQRNSELWTVDFFRRIRATMAGDAVLLTYSTAKPVLAGLLEAGFTVGFHCPGGSHRPSCIATTDPGQLPATLPAHVLEALQNTAGGIPYRDPTQTAANREILRARQTRVLEWKTHQ